jgi:hypothetical protein
LTHNPNIVELLRYFASPGGNLLWDVLLQALGIFFTVVIPQRYFDRQEEKRWRPARQDLYLRLFSHAGWLIKMVPGDVREGGPQGAYTFGYGGIGGRVGPEVSRSITRLRPGRLKDVVESLADDPTLLEQFEENLDATLRYSAAIFLAKDPGLSSLLADFRDWLTHFKRILEGYREVREADREVGRDPKRGADSDLLKQACVQLRELIIEANRLQTYLAGPADESGPSGSGPARHA